MTEGERLLKTMRFEEMRMSDLGHMRACGGSALFSAIPAGVLLLGAVGPGTVSADAPAGPDGERAKVTDFAHSYCTFAPPGEPVWARAQIECRCETFDRSGAKSGEYVMAARTQRGLETDPASGALAPGRDCWVIVSKEGVYIRRNHASAYVRDSSRLSPAESAKSGWRLQPANARPLRSAVEFREALMNWRPIVARTELRRADGSRAFAVEYPVAWSDAHFKKEAFRVETGPVLLVDPERVVDGKALEFDDFQWAYLDFRGFDGVRCFIERPTSLTDCVTSPKYGAATPATADKVEKIEARLYSGWTPPVPFESLRKVFQTSHYSLVRHLKVKTSLYVLDRAGAAPAGGAASASVQAGETAAGRPDRAVTAPPPTARSVTDFSQSFCYFVPRTEDTWRVRIQLECRAEMIDVKSGASDLYMLGVRTQSGAWHDPPQTPGYDFWMAFSKRRVYIKRVQPSSLLRVSSQVPPDHFLKSGWKVESSPATPLRTAAEIRDALRAWRPLVARTVFESADGAASYVIDYPVQWAETNTDTGGFRVRTGPVLLLDPDRVKVGEAADFDELRWAYLDFTDLTTLRCLIARPTSLLASAAGQGTLGNLPDRNPVLSPAQAAQIERRLHTGQRLPLPPETMEKLFQTNHYSTVERRTATTTLYALPAPSE